MNTTAYALDPYVAGGIIGGSVVVVFACLMCICACVGCCMSKTETKLKKKQEEKKDDFFDYWQQDSSSEDEPFLDVRRDKQKETVDNIEMAVLATDLQEVDIDKNS